jgi:membrane-bound serine protease (ClpP class)
VSVTEQEAVKLKVVDLVASDVSDLLVKVDGRRVEIQGRPVVLRTANAVVQGYDMRLRQRVLDVIANPNVAYLLMMAGMLGLYVEFTSPGVVFPGAAGVICLLLAMAALQVLPINYTGLALVAVGAAMLGAEAFLPTFGIIGVAGIVAFVLGSLLLFDTPDSTVRVNRWLIAGTALTLGAVTAVIGWLVIRTQRRRSSVGAEGMIGERGEVRRVQTPGKVKVFVRGEYWDGDSDEPLEVGDAVEVSAVNGLRLRVRRRPPTERTA